MSELIHKDLGPYHIEDQIGSGGMATVYKAHHAATDRYVALKVLSEEMSLDDEIRQRFDQEARVIANLEHKHILPVYAYEGTGDRLYLVMRYVEAGTLKERMAAGQMDLTEMNRILHQVGEALHYAHQRGVVHRDIKPSNVLIDDQGDCYLTDFGLARIMASTARFTKTGVGIGTPDYMSPEQGKGGEIDARSDIYSLGVVLYEMVTGEVPYQAETPLAVMLKHINEPLPSLRSVNPQVPEEVEQVILKAMAKDPDSRFQTVHEMVDAFDEAVRQAQLKNGITIQIPPKTARGKPADEPSRAQAARAPKTRWVWAAAGVMAAGILLVLAFLFLPGHIPTDVQSREGQIEPVRATQLTPTPKVEAPVTSTPTATLAETIEASATAQAIQTPTSQPTATMTPPPTPTRAPVQQPGPTISPDNVAQVNQRAHLELGSPSQIAWSPDGRWLAVVAYGIHLLDAQTLQPTWSDESGGWSTRIAFSPDGQTLAVASAEGTRLLDATSGGQLRTFADFRSAESIAFSPDGTLLALAIDKAVQLIEVASGRQIDILLAHRGKVKAVAFAPDGQTLASSSLDGVRLWDVTSRTERLTLPHTNWVDSIAFSPDGQTLATIAHDAVKLWDTTSGRELRTFTGHAADVTGVAFAPDGQILASASRDVTIKLWEGTSGRELCTLKGHTDTVTHIAFAPDGATLASGADDGTVRLWGIEP